MLPIVQVIDRNKLRWFGEERRRVHADGCDGFKDEGKETKRKTKTKGSSRIVIIFTSVHSVLFFVTPSQKRTFKMLTRNNPYQNGRACIINRWLQTGARNKSSGSFHVGALLQSLIVDN